MSVAKQLGFFDADTLPINDFKRAEWCELEPDLKDLIAALAPRAYLKSLTSDQADRVLLPLLRLASADGNSDYDALLVLAWILLPGAAVLARQLRDLNVDIDVVVASHLWEQLRTYSCRSGRRVAANVLRNTRTAVLNEFDRSRHRLSGAEQVRRLTLLRDPVVLDQHDVPWLVAPSGEPELDPGEGQAHAWATAATNPLWPTSPDPEQELLDVLEWATTTGVISGEQRELLLSLVEVLSRTPAPYRRLSAQGLMTRTATAEVAARFGVGERTIRRRVHVALAALAAASDRYLQTA